MHCFIYISPKGWLDVQLMCNCTVSLQQPLLPSITVHACISKFMSEWEVGQIGPIKWGCSKHWVDMNYEQHIYHPLQMISWKSSGANAKHTDTRMCTCKNHGLECSAACGECKGISCTNFLLIPGEQLNDEDHTTRKGKYLRHWLLYLLA